MREHYDFTEARRGAVVKTNKQRIAIYLDADIIEWFHHQVEGGGNYQDLMNDALREYIRQQQGQSLEEILRRVIREELRISS